MIKLVLLDFDGIFTNGEKIFCVDKDNNLVTFGKIMADKDRTAIKRMKQGGLHVIVISGDRQINEAYCNMLNIPFWYNDRKNKLDFLQDIKNKYNVQENEIVFVGDDCFDLDLGIIIRKSYGLFAVPNNATQAVHEHGNLSLGQAPGIIDELYEKLNFMGLLENYILVPIDE
jgi:3-deoxy-D-manno-octulosonate 8-phosphate phosphatase (KDO 8-P phosphatase)